MEQPTSNQPVYHGIPIRKLIAGHVINLVLLLVIFLGTQYLTQAQGCDSAASFRWAIIAAAVYGLISAMALRRWYHSNSK